MSQDNEAIVIRNADVTDWPRRLTLKQFCERFGVVIENAHVHVFIKYGEYLNNEIDILNDKVSEESDRASLLQLQLNASAEEVQTLQDELLVKERNEQFLGDQLTEEVARTSLELNASAEEVEMLQNQLRAKEMNEQVLRDQLAQVEFNLREDVAGNTAPNPVTQKFLALFALDVEHVKMWFLVHRQDQNWSRAKQERVRRKTIESRDRLRQLEEWEWKWPINTINGFISENFRNVNLEWNGRSRTLHAPLGDVTDDLMKEIVQAFVNQRNPADILVDHINAMRI